MGQGQKLWCGVRLHLTSTLPIHTSLPLTLGSWSIAYLAEKLICMVLVCATKIRFQELAVRVWPFYLAQKMVFVIAMSAEILEIPLMSLSEVFPQVMCVHSVGSVCLFSGWCFAAQKPFSWSEIAISGPPAFKLLLLRHAIPIRVWNLSQIYGHRMIKVMILWPQLFGLLCFVIPVIVLNCVFMGRNVVYLRLKFALREWSGHILEGLESIWFCYILQ